jgi:transcription elongation GreA/GreB family factor
MLNQKIISLIKQSKKIWTIPTDQQAVSFGSRIFLKAKTGLNRTLTIVGPSEIDPARGMYNYFNEKIQSLLGLKVNESCDLMNEKWRIEKIEKF